MSLNDLFGYSILVVCGVFLVCFGSFVVLWCWYTWTDAIYRGVLRLRQYITALLSDR